MNFIESEIIQGGKILIKMSDIQSVWISKQDGYTKYKVQVGDKCTFTFSKENGEEIYSAYRDYLVGDLRSNKVSKMPADVSHNYLK